MKFDRIISMSTKQGDIVFDPFGGSETTYIVAEMLGRRWIGSELGNCKIISDRFANIEKDKAIFAKVCEEKKRIVYGKCKRAAKKEWILVK